MSRTLTLLATAIVLCTGFAIAVATLPAADAEPSPEIVSLRATEGELSGSTTTTTAPPPPPTTTTTAPAPPPTTTTTAAPPAPQPPPTTVPAVRSGSCQGWGDLLAAYFPPEQVDKACSVMLCESGGNPSAANPSSTASGLFQFLDGTWTSTTGQPPPASAYSPEAQIGAAAQLWQSSGWGPWSCA